MGRVSSAGEVPDLPWHLLRSPAALIQVAAARGAVAADEGVRILAHAIIGQCVVFGPGRSIILARLGWDTVTPARFERIAEAVGGSVLAALGLPLAAAKAGPGGGGG